MAWKCKKTCIQYLTQGWNVKLERYNKKIDGVYNWNISRMECKDNEEEDKYILSSGLEYIQNGM